MWADTIIVTGINLFNGFNQNHTLKDFISYLSTIYIMVYYYSIDGFSFGPILIIRWIFLMLMKHDSKTLYQFRGCYWCWLIAISSAIYLFTPNIDIRVQKYSLFQCAKRLEIGSPHSCSFDLNIKRIEVYFFSSFSDLSRCLVQE